MKRYTLALMLAFAVGLSTGQGFPVTDFTGRWEPVGTTHDGHPSRISVEEMEGIVTITMHYVDRKPRAVRYRLIDGYLEAIGFTPRLYELDIAPERIVLKDREGKGTSYMHATAAF